MLCLKAEEQPLTRSQERGSEGPSLAPSGEQALPTHCVPASRPRDHEVSTLAVLRRSVRGTLSWWPEQTTVIRGPWLPYIFLPRPPPASEGIYGGFNKEPGDADVVGHRE